MAETRHAIPLVWLQQEAWNWTHPNQNNTGRGGVTQQSRRLWERLTLPQQDHLRNTIRDFDLSRNRLNGMGGEDEALDLRRMNHLKTAIRQRSTLSAAQRQVITDIQLLRLIFDRNEFNHLLNQDTRDYLADLETVYEQDLADTLHYIRNHLIPNYHDLKLAWSLGEGWVGSWRLGAGGFGTADLLVKQNSHGMIIDRVVIKDTAIPTRNHILWDAAWTEPTEVGAMQALNVLEGSDAIVYLRNWRLGAMTARAVEAERRPYRLYLEFCPGGDLYALMVKCSPGQLRTEDKLLSEPFIWHVFECLAMAGKLMASGSLQTPSPANWVPIIHRDIKLQNVFIGENISDRFPGFPMPKLGDFGQAVFVTANDPRHPNEFGNSGTISNFPAEQWYHRRLGGMYTFTYEAGPRRLTSAANVWAIGNVIWSLLMLSQGDEHLNFLNPARREPRLDLTAMEKYSRRLQDLVMECVRFMPEYRPSIDAVLGRINNALQGHLSRSFTRGLRSRPARSRRWNRYAIMQRQDRWPVRSMLTDAPPLSRRRVLPEPPQNVSASPSTDDTDSSDDLGSQPGVQMVLSEQSV